MDENGCSWINSIRDDIGDDVGYDVNDDIRDVIHNIASLSSNEFHEDWSWVCLDMCQWNVFMLSMAFDNYLIDLHMNALTL